MKRELRGWWALAALLPACAAGDELAIEQRNDEPLHVTTPGVGSEAQGAGVAAVNLDANPRPELLVMAYDNPSAAANTFRYRVLPNLSADGVPTMTGPTIEVAGFGEAEGAAMATANLDADARPELLLLAYTQPSSTSSRQFRWKVGANLRPDGTATSWGAARALYWTGAAAATGAGAALGAIGGDARPDLVLMYNEDGAGSDTFRWRVGYDLDATGRATSWSPVRSTAGVGDHAQGAGVAITDIDRNGRPELVLLAYENPAGQNSFRYRVAWNLSSDATPSRTDASYTTVDGVGAEGAGADVTAASLDGDPRPELVLAAYDDPSGANTFRYKVVRDADAATVYPGPDLIGTWTPRTDFTTVTAPALTGGFPVLAAAVDASGAVWASSMTSFDAWNLWGRLAASGAAPMSPMTSPVIVTGDAGTFMVARGNDDNLYTATRAGSSWSTLTPRTAGGAVRGRVSAALTGTAASPMLHVAYVADRGVRYERFDAAGSLAARDYPGALDAAVGSDGAGAILLAVRYADHVVFERATGRAWTPAQVGARYPLGPGGEVLDVAAPVYWAGAFHVLYAQKYVNNDITRDVTYALTHERFLASGGGALARVVARYAPSGDRAARATLAVWRNKLVALWREPDGALRFARFDNADPALPWVEHGRVAGGASRDRPGLAVLGTSRDELVSLAMGDATFARLYGIPAGRAVMRDDVASQFALYRSNSDGSSTVCRDQSDPYGPTPVDLTQDARGFVSQLGTSLWMLPRWFERGLYQRTARHYCEAGLAAASGRFDPPCGGGSRMPVITREADAVFVCGGLWVSSNARAMRIWEELGHYTATGMGLRDDTRRPGDDDAARCNIPLAALQSAYDLFGQRVAVACARAAPDGRCRGFVDAGGTNYDATSRQHSFLYVVYRYLDDGDALRQMAADDAAAGDTLLQRKYDWVRQSLFRGVEFRAGFEPLTPP